MKYTAEIINFGKIKKAKIQFSDLTVLVAPNNTGKSYVSRLLYSIFSSITPNPQIDYQKHLVLELISNLVKASARFSRNIKSNKDDEYLIDSLTNKMWHTENKLLQIVNSENLSLDRTHKTKEIIDKGLEVANSFISELKTTAQKLANKANNKKAKQKSKDTSEKALTEYHKELDDCLAKFQNELAKGAEYLIETGYMNKFKHSLLHNFQAEELKHLLGEPKKASIKIKSEDGDVISLEISKAGEIDSVFVDVIDPNIYSNVVYLESPIYWKLKEVLDRGHFSYSTMDDQKRLIGVPKYLQDLTKKMKEKNITDKKDAEIRDNLSQEIKDVIGGNIIEDKNSGELLFVETQKGKKTAKKGISLHLTATGVYQLGMIAFFIDTKVIRHGTILFVDEPEAHLHPEWQDKMMEILYGFTKYGVKVIMATHSSMLMQRLELFMKQDKKPQEIALNYFDPSGKFDSTGKTPKQVRDEIAKSLEEPAYNNYIQSL